MERVLWVCGVSLVMGVGLGAAYVAMARRVMRLSLARHPDLLQELEAAARAGGSTWSQAGELSRAEHRFQRALKLRARQDRELARALRLRTVFFASMFLAAAPLLLVVMGILETL